MMWADLKAFRDELDALPTATDGPPMEQRMRCTACGGKGEIGIAGTSINPFSGTSVVDPQLDTRDECPMCEGQGLFPPLEEPS